MTSISMNTALDLALEKAGGLRPLARAIGIAPQSIAKWRRVPAERVLSIEKITGVERSLLRPDIYPLEREVITLKPTRTERLKPINITAKDQPTTIKALVTHSKPETYTIKALVTHTTPKPYTINALVTDTTPKPTKVRIRCGR